MGWVEQVNESDGLSYVETREDLLPIISADGRGGLGIIWEER